MVNTIMGAQVLEQAVEYAPSIFFPVCAAVIGLVVFIVLFKLGCVISDFTMSMSGCCIGAFLGFFGFLLAFVFCTRVVWNTNGEYSDFLRKIPAVLTTEVTAYAIDLSKVTDALAFYRQYDLRPYTGELEGHIVWVLEK